MDNTDLLQTDPSNDEYWDIATKLQASVELWEKCTEISGGCKNLVNISGLYMEGQNMGIYKWHG